MIKHKKRRPLGAFFSHVVRLLRLGRIDESLDLQDGLSWVGVGVDRHRLGLGVLFALRVEFHFDFAACSWRNGLLWALGHGASA